MCKNCQDCKADMYFQAYNDLQALQKRDAYEQAKHDLQSQNLSAADYEQAIRKLVAELKI